MQQQLRFNPRQQRFDVQGKLRHHELTKVNSYAPGSWKQYVNNEGSSSKSSSRSPSLQQAQATNGTHYKQYEAKLQYEDENRARSILSIRREEERKRKEDVMRKVIELRDKVLPMVSNRDDEEEDVMLAWQTRMEQKLARLETLVDNIQKQATIELQKRILKIESKWENKMTELCKSIEHLLP